MRLLFDQNLSPKLAARLADIFPGSLHVKDVNLDKADDIVLWEYASNYDLIIVSKDVDFSERSIICGFPPKVIWIRRGNCSTIDIENILRAHLEDIEYLSKNPHIGVLSLL